MKIFFPIARIGGVKGLPQKSLFLALVMAHVAFAAFFAEYHTVSLRHHEHNRHGTEGACSVCFELERSQILLESLGRLGCIVLAAGCIILGAKDLTKPGPAFCAAPSLIALKVRLNS